MDFYDNKVNLEIELEEASTIADDNQSVISDATEGMNNVVLKKFSLYKYLIVFIVPDVNDVLAEEEEEEEEEKSMFNPNLLKPTDIPIPEQYIANAKKQKKSMKTLTKLNMQLERNKEAAKKKHKKTTARTILKENIGNTNVLRGADILLIKKHNKKNKNVKRYAPLAKMRST